MTAAPASVGAQPAPAAPAPAPSPANKAEAKKLVDAGIKAYDQKDYDKAIDLYQQAYALMKHPLLLFNIAQAHQFAGHLDEATRYYDQYLAAEPNGAKAQEARDNLTIIKNMPRPAPPAPTPEPAPAEPPAPPAEKVMPTPSVSMHADTPAHPGRTLRIAGLATAGVGVACAGVAIAYGLRLERIEKAQLERFNQGLPYEPGEVKKGEAAQRNQYITAVLAGSFVVGGGVLYWMGHRQGRRETATAWVPLVSPDGAGLALTGLLP
jgi:tetratricopeptide (TPR) repeat protein